MIANQESFVLAKPESLCHFGMICHEVESIGRVTYMHRILIRLEMVDAIYNHVHPMIKAEHLAHLVGRYCQIVAVTGPNIVESIRQYVGTHPNPEKCDPSSLRHRLWSKGNTRFSKFLAEGVDYHYNYAHCPKTHDESESHLPILLGEFWSGPILQ